MKKIFAAILLICVIMSSNLAAYAQEVEKPQPSLDVRAEANEALPIDYAIVAVNVDTAGEQAKDALKLNLTTVTAVVAALEKVELPGRT